MLELVQDDVENEGLDDATGGVVEDVVIQDVEDVVDVIVDFEDEIVVVELWEDEVDEDKWEIFVVELLEDVVEVVDVLEDVGDVYEIGAPGVVDDL